MDRIKDIYTFGLDIELVTPEEEALLTDWDRRETIASIRSNLGAAKVFYNKPYIDSVDDGVKWAIGGVEGVLKSPAFPIDKAAFLDRVLDHVEAVRKLMEKSHPWYAQKAMPKYIKELVAMRDSLTQAPATAPREELVPTPF